MKFTLAQYNIIRDLLADEVDAVGCDLANMEERFKRNQDNFTDDEYAEAKAEIAEVKKRYNELNRILDKFNEEF